MTPARLPRSSQDMATTTILLIIVLLSYLSLNSSTSLVSSARSKEYFYTRTREDPQHLRISEEFKNQYLDEVKYESKINGTKYEYYKSTLSMSHDELVFETIDKIFRHRLSPFYLHHYDNEEDKRRASDSRLVSPEACAKDLLYLVDKLPKKKYQSNSYTDNVNMNDEDHLTPELTAFFDSYARQEAGLLMGNTYWVGAYDQCVNRHIFELTNSHPSRESQHKFLTMTDSRESGSTIARRQQVGEDPDQKVVDFKGRYCVSALKAPSWDAAIKQKKLKARSYFKSERTFNDYAKLFRLQVGICLPSSCDSTALDRHADEIKLLTSAHLEQRFADYELVDLYCLPDETSPLRSLTQSTSALNFIILMSVWLTTLFLATLADVFEFVDSLEATAKNSGDAKKHRKLRQLVEWLSLRANYRKLMRVADEHATEKTDSSSANAKENIKESKQLDTQETAQTEEKTAPQDDKTKKDSKSSQVSSNHADDKEELRINLRFLNAFKALIMFWIVNGHIMLLMIQTAKNILYSDALLNGLMHFLIGATFGVDLFFTMTGFLTSYLIFNSGHAYKMKPATWLYLSFHRYWRLAPMYLLAFWFSKSVVQLMGSGPLWDYGTSAMTFRGLCNTESWWYPLTLTSNLHGLFEECMITSWYISCDMQFWLLSPIFIHLLAKSPAAGWVASLSVIFMSLKVRYDSLLGDPSARHDELVQPRADIFMRVSHDMPTLYTHPHFRIPTYIVGLLAGHYVYMIKSGKWHSSVAELFRREQEVRDSLVRTQGLESKQQVVDQQTGNEKEQRIGNECDQLEGEPKQTCDSTTNESVRNEVLKETSEKKIEKNKKDEGRWKRNAMAYGGVFLILIMSFISYLLANYFPNSFLRYSKEISAIAYSVDHLMMAVGASLLITSLCFGQWSNLVKILSHPNWTRLSKLNYALLLLQCEAIYFQIFRYEQVPVAGTRELINILFNLLVTLYPLAFVATLVFEFPLANLEKLILPAGGKSKNQQQKQKQQHTAASTETACN